MQSLFLLALLVAVTIASPVSESSEMEKRLLPGLLGAGGEGGGGGLIGGVLGGKDGGPLAGLLGLVTGLLDTVLELVSGVTGGLGGKTTKRDILAEFDERLIQMLRRALPNEEYAAARKSYCAIRNWRPSD